MIIHLIDIIIHLDDYWPMARFRMLFIPTLSTTFGFVTGHAIDKPWAMAGFGLFWGIAVMVVAPLIARRSAFSTAQANAPVYVMVLLAFAVLGAAIVVHVVGATPAAFLQLAQQRGYGLFFYAVHGSFEWLLMPWALIANWPDPKRRRLLIVAALFFYAGRIASALYFAPIALYWVQNPAEAAAHLDEVGEWMRWYLVRLIGQDAVMAALLAAVSLQGQRKRAPARGALLP
jgi:hypothetical protein